MVNILQIIKQHERITILDVLQEEEQNGTMEELDKRNPNHPLRRAKDYVNGQRRRKWSKPERKYRLAYRRRPLAREVLRGS